MALYQIKISYDGTEYHGYQRQVDQCSIQGEIELALKTIGWVGNSIQSSGRTDTGVHAEGQIAVFELGWKHSAQELQNAINSALPLDISILEINDISKSPLHPRYDAKTRVYRYQIYCSSVRKPVYERFCWRIWPEPNLNLLNQAASMLEGRHDFKGFGKPYKKGGRTERIVKSASWSKLDKDKIIFRIEANSFLYHMVRRVVFVQTLAGQEKIDLENVAEEIEGIYNLPPGIAPAKGLFLEKITY